MLFIINDENGSEVSHDSWNKKRRPILEWLSTLSPTAFIRSRAGDVLVESGFPFASVLLMPYSPRLMETNTKSVLTDLQAFDVASLKGRLIELRRYL